MGSPRLVLTQLTTCKSRVHLPRISNAALGLLVSWLGLAALVYVAARIAAAFVYTPFLLRTASGWAELAVAMAWELPLKMVPFGVALLCWIYAVSGIRLWRTTRSSHVLLLSAIVLIDLIAEGALILAIAMTVDSPDLSPLQTVGLALKPMLNTPELVELFGTLGAMVLLPWVVLRSRMVRLGIVRFASVA